MSGPKPAPPPPPGPGLRLVVELDPTLARRFLEAWRERNALGIRAGRPLSKADYARELLRDGIGAGLPRDPTWVGRVGGRSPDIDR